MFPRMSYNFTFSSEVHERSNFSILQLGFSVVLIFTFSYSDGCSFNLYFSTCAYLPSDYQNHSVFYLKQILEIFLFLQITSSFQLKNFWKIPIDSLTLHLKVPFSLKHSSTPKPELIIPFFAAKVTMNAYLLWIPLCSLSIVAVIKVCFHESIYLSVLPTKLCSERKDCLTYFCLSGPFQGVWYV